MTVRRWAPTVAYVAMAVALAVAVERSAHHDAVEVRDALVASCERVNVLRAEVNRRSGVHRLDAELLAETLRFAATLSPADTDRARFRAFARRAAQLPFRDVPLTDCQAQIPRP